jgi:hypothetical protein
MSTRRESQARVQKMAEAAAFRSTDQTRHRCFVSYHVDDEADVSRFLDDFGDQFIGTVVGVTADDDFVDSDDTDYIMDQIRERYLGPTTVTIVLVGSCTWSRKFVDWEVYATLRTYESYAPSGLLAINLPYMGDKGKLPSRVSDNVKPDNGYARYLTYPSSKSSLRDWIEVAYEARSTKTHLIDNSRERRRQNSAC